MKLNLGGEGGGAVFSCENTPEGLTGTHKSLFRQYKQVSETKTVIIKNLAMFSYYVIYFDKFPKVIQRTEKEALKWLIDIFRQLFWLHGITSMTIAACPNIV